MRKFFCLLLACLPLRSLAQVSDNFSDGEFINNPVWGGHTSDFIVNASGQLQLSDDVAATSFLSTPFSTNLLGEAEWRFYIKLTFAPSGTNFSRYYLTSDQPDLTSPLNGYYLQLGEPGTSDAIELFKQTGLTSVSILRGNEASLAAAFQVSIKVIRDAYGNWQLLTDYTGGTNYMLEKTSTDNTHLNAGYSGVWCTYTISNSSKFFFDDFFLTNTWVDVVTPTLESLTITESTQLQLKFSEEVESNSAQTLSNYFVNNGIGEPILAQLQADGKTVQLTFLNSFPNADTSMITMRHVQDVVGNVLTETQHDFFFFESVPPVRHDIVFTEIFADPTPAIGLPEAEYVELYNRSHKIFNLANWKYKDGTMEKTLSQYFFRPGEYLVLVNSSSTALFYAHNNVVGISGFPTLTNTGEPLVILDDVGTPIDSVFYDDDWHSGEDTKAGGYSLERINYENFCLEDKTNWTSSEASVGGTPGAVNTVLDNTPDTQGPRIIKAQILSSTKLLLHFNENLAATPPTISSFAVSPLIQIHTIEQTSPNSITIELNQALTPSIPYTLSANTVYDCSGNSIDEEFDEMNVVLPERAEISDLILTEIFADPTPSVGLPQAEFVEVVNRSNKVIDLYGFIFSDGTTSAVCPSYLLYPQTYLIITHTASATLYENNGMVLGLNDFPTLNNSGEFLSLKRNDGRVLDSLHYKLTWYQDENKQEGGWTLERRDLNNFCLEGDNWKASLHISGGTPGAQNSVFTTQADSEGPSLRSVNISSPTELTLLFSEKLAALLPEKDDFIITPFATVSSVEFTDNTLYHVRVALSAPLDSGTVYEISLRNLRDCSGNSTPESRPVAFGIPVKASWHDVIISEIMSDPSPVVGLPETEYIELYNRTNQWIDVSKWKILDATDTTTLPAATILPYSFALLLSTTATSAADTLSATLRVPSFISLSNSGEKLVVTDSLFSVIDSVTYSQRWAEENKKDGGWSLEKIDPKNVCVEESNNWKSSHSIRGGTPGNTNSVNGEVVDTTAPQLISVIIQNEQSLLLRFDEKIVSTLLLNSFAMEPYTPLQEVLFTEASHRSLLLTYSTPFERSTTYTLTINGLLDCSGNEVNQQSTFVLAEQAVVDDVLISEIMADPSPTVELPDEEYIELVNRSTKYIDLNGWKIRAGLDESTLPSFMLAPQEYVVLSAHASLYTAFGKTIQVNLPALTNSGKSVSLKSAQGITIDSLQYQLSWYHNEDKQQGGWSLERMELNNACLEEKNWTVSGDERGGTPGIKNSVFTLQADTIAPVLLHAEMVDSTHLILYFNERLSDEVLLPTQVEINPPLFIASTSTSPSERKIHIDFAVPLTQGKMYEVRLTGVKDCTGNSLTGINNKEVFGIPIGAQLNDVIINEIMADPSPMMGLPEVEFVEVYNRTDQLLSVNHWKISDGKDTAVFSFPVLLPNEYKIIASITAAANLSQFKAVGLMNFPTLDNTGEWLGLLNAANKIMDSIRFKLSWYNDTAREEGGWSLERIKAEEFCVEEKLNWRASRNVLGGTPGLPNSTAGITADTLAPKVLSAFLMDSTHLFISFTEKIASELTTSMVAIQPAVQIESVAFTNTSRTNTILKFKEALSASTLYTISIHTLSDCAGNVLTEPNNKLQLALPEQAYEQDIIITEIFADPSPAIGLPEVEYIELYNRSAKYLDLKDWSFSDGTTTAILPSHSLSPGSYVVLTSATAGLASTLAVANFPALNNSGEALILSNNEGVTIDRVHYVDTWYKDVEKQEGGWSIERIDLNNFCAEQENWKASINSSGGTPGLINSVNGIVEDEQPPNIQSVQVLENNLVQIVFTERIDRTSLSASSIIITPLITIEAVQVVDAALTTAHIRLAQSITEGTVYTLEIKHVKDCSGNEVDSTTKVKVGRAIEASYKDVIITEIMANPSPAIGLPEAEYIEVLNRSNKLIRVKEWTLHDNGTVAILPDALLLPSEYVILCSPVVASSLSFFGRTLAVSGFPSLTNTGEMVLLKNNKRVVIDSVVYSSTWYKNYEKEEGGWSLELIDIDIECGEENNWEAAEAEKGGTPGQQNSIKSSKPDVTGPRLLTATPASTTELIVTFDEILSKQGSTIQVVLQPTVQLDNIVFTDASRKQVRMQLSETLLTGQLYELSATVYDCAGNFIQENFSTTTFALPEDALPGDVWLNEILFNPRPFGVDFVEVYNTSNKFINLKNWKVSSLEHETPVNEKNISEEDFLLPPHTFLVLTPNPANIQTEYPQSRNKNFKQTDLPSLNDDEGSVALITSSGALLDAYFYTEERHSPLLKDKEGVSLERITQGNWKSGVVTTNFATPGYANANTSPAQTSSEEVAIVPEIFEPVYGQPNFTSIQYKFNRSGFVANAKVLDAQGRLIKRLTNNEVLATEGFFTWYGDQDDGTQARVGYYTLWMEVFDTSGIVKTFRKRIVIASRF